jgi:solute carrier family 45, member 1/2/4
MAWYVNETTAGLLDHSERHPGFPFCSMRMFIYVFSYVFDFFRLTCVSRTTYIGQIMAYQDNKDPDVDIATRAGNFALLMYSLVAVVAGSLLPELTKRDERLLDGDEWEDEDMELARIQRTVMKWKAEAESRGKSPKLPRMPLSLRDVWGFAMVLFGVISLFTFFIGTVTEVWVSFCDKPQSPIHKHRLQLLWH